MDQRQDSDKIRKDYYNLERKILRTIYGLVYEHDSWRIANNEIKNKYNSYNIVAAIKSRG